MTANYHSVREDAITDLYDMFDLFGDTNYSDPSWDIYFKEIVNFYCIFIADGDIDMKLALAISEYTY